MKIYKYSHNTAFLQILVCSKFYEKIKKLSRSKTYKFLIYQN